MVALTLHPTIDIGNQRLDEAYQSIGGNQPDEIPFLIWLLENPDSPLALPGAINLQNHDCLHLLLNRGFSPSDEAFVVGFTMGSDPKLLGWQLTLFKVVSRYFYPPVYRLSNNDLKCFSLGVYYGQKMIFPGLNKIDLLKRFGDMKISEIRQFIGISLDELILMWKTEDLLVNQGMLIA